jgi:two-component system, OmpR family, sensor kinase
MPHTVAGAPRPVVAPAQLPSPRSPEAAPSPTSSPPSPASVAGWWRVLLGSIRLRVLLAFAVLLACSAVLSLVAARQALVLRLEARMGAAMAQEMDELRRLLDDGRDPQTGQPFTSLAAAFDVYMARNVPSAEEALLAFVDGGLYRADLRHYPQPDVPDEVIESWAGSASPSGPARTSSTYSTPVGDAHFRVDRITFRGDDGAFVVTILPVAEMRELDGLLTWGLAVAAGVLLFATACAWPLAGRALAPVRELTAAARSISESDLTRRIEVRSSGESAEMAASFNAMLDRLESVLCSQRKFVEDASHELRDPLTIVRGHLELLDDDPVARRRTVEMLLDEVERMSRIVGDLQVLADVDQPDFLRPAPVDLAVLTEELIVKAGMLGDRTWQLDAAAGGVVVADRHRLTEAVMNLAHNAVQHTGPGDVIGIGTARDSDVWRLWVRDTGVGVEGPDAARIFERFTRGTGAARRYQGAGLGLSIVTAVAEAHGGRVELDSRLGQGARFTLVLPSEPDSGAG